MRRTSTMLIALVALGGLLMASSSQAQKRRMRDYQNALQKRMDGRLSARADWTCQVNLLDSPDREGQDVELRITMPIDVFMEFAPIAALEAAAVPHKFPVGDISLREERTSRVGRVAFRDAEPIAGRYLAGDKNAVNEMKDAIIWH